MPFIKLVDSKLIVDEPEEVSKLSSSFIGKIEGGKLVLKPEEALYLMDMRGFECIDERNNRLSFNDVALMFIKENPKLLAFYNAYRNWRDRGLFITRLRKNVRYGKRKSVRYPSKKVSFPRLNQVVVYYPFDMFSIAEKNPAFMKLFADFWFGQVGVYKQHERGKLVKFDVFETLFLQKYCGIRVRNAETGKLVEFEELMELATKNKKDLRALYEVYEDWRLRGFVVKTGYKFGSHFRIYFPGVSPVRKDKWIHSKHVLHVFPKYERLIISEWARVVRVAHSVRKTFILGIPGMKDEDYVKGLHLDFIAYHREGGMTITPTSGDPSFVILSLSEDETIGGAELATALREAEKVGLDLLLAVTDRETDVTYYLTRKIDLPGSKYEYYEIEWIQP